MYTHKTLVLQWQALGMCLPNPQISKFPVNLIGVNCCQASKFCDFNFFNMSSYVV